MVAIGVNALFATAIAQLTSSWSWGWYGKPTFQLAGCSIASFTPSFPSGQSALVAPTTPPSFIGLAFGVQNYTCSSSNNFTSTGAVAELIDVSCIVSQPSFATIQNDLYNVWTNLVPSPIQAVIDLLHLVNPPEVLAQHYFIPNPSTGQGLSPKWDFTSSGAFQGNQAAFVTAKGKGTLPAPTNATRDVAWLDVVAIQGDVADEVFRFDTVGGQPPSSCVSGQTPDISVKYVSKYIFYGGKLGAPQQSGSSSGSSYGSSYGSSSGTSSGSSYGSSSGSSYGSSSGSSSGSSYGSSSGSSYGSSSGSSYGSSKSSYGSSYKSPYGSSY